MSRVLVIANKYWEADPLVHVLLADGNREGETPFARPPDPASPRRPLGTVAVSAHPVLAQPKQPARIPRVTWSVGPHAVEIWCLQDLLGSVSGDDASSTQRKVEALGTFLTECEPAAAVVAVGTAGHPEAALAPGSVAVGRRFFIHDSNAHRPPNPKSAWPPPPEAGGVMGGEQGFAADAFSAWQRAAAAAAEARFLRSPLRPADLPLLVASDRWVAAATVNVTDYRDYAWADLATLEAWREAQRAKLLVTQVGSVETTHSVIGLAAMARTMPFVWVSGIANAAGHFAAQVGQRTHAQNFVAAHNAGIAVAWLVPELLRTLNP